MTNENFARLLRGLTIAVGNRRNRILLYQFLAAEIRALHCSYGVGDDESYKRALTFLENCERYTLRSLVRRSAKHHAEVTVDLAPPKAVADATETYLEGEDAIALWLEEETIEDVNSWISISSLFNSWKLWSEAAGEYTGTQRRFSQNLESKGLVYERRHGGARGFRGRRWPV
jgi:hypothetical protein